MPDVAFFYEDKLVEDGLFPYGKKPEELRERLKPEITKQMDCRDASGRFIVHTPEQITFVSFEPLPDSGDKMVVMQIFAYDWPDRMRNIDKRLKEIGFKIQALLALPAHTVDISFIPIPRQGGWVNV